MKLSEDIYTVSDPHIQGIGGLKDVPDPAALALLVTPRFTCVLAYVMECEVV